jgi:hypothetical protein
MDEKLDPREFPKVRSIWLGHHWIATGIANFLNRVQCLRYGHWRVEGDRRCWRCESTSQVTDVEGTGNEQSSGRCKASRLDERYKPAPPYEKRCTHGFGTEPCPEESSTETQGRKDG